MKKQKMYIEKNKNILKAIFVLITCLFLGNQLIWAYSPQTDTLRPLATVKSDEDIIIEFSFLLMELSRYPTKIRTFYKLNQELQYLLEVCYLFLE